jgi:hypothetical protein
MVQQSEQSFQIAVFLPVGYGVAGWATDLLGAPLIFLIGGALTVALIGLGLLHPAIRNLD